LSPWGHILQQQQIAIIEEKSGAMPRLLTLFES
jgi:hypothetical protein